MNYRGLELKLRKIVEKRLEEGWELWSGGGRGFIGNESAHCCLLGAVALELGASPGINISRTEIVSRVAKRFSISPSLVMELENGFEGSGRYQMTVEGSEVHRIGVGIRRDYFEVAS